MDLSLMPDRRNRIRPSLEAPSSSSFFSGASIFHQSCQRRRRRGWKQASLKSSYGRGGEGGNSVSGSTCSTINKYSTYKQDSRKGTFVTLKWEYFSKPLHMLNNQTHQIVCFYHVQNVSGDTSLLIIQTVSFCLGSTLMLSNGALLWSASRKSFSSLKDESRSSSVLIPISLRLPLLLLRCRIWSTFLFLRALATQSFVHICDLTLNCDRNDDNAKRRRCQCVRDNQSTLWGKVRSRHI